MFRIATIFSIIAILSVTSKVACADMDPERDGRIYITIYADEPSELNLGAGSTWHQLVYYAADEVDWWRREIRDPITKKYVLEKAGPAEWDLKLGNGISPGIRHCSLHRAKDIPAIDTQEWKKMPKFFQFSSERNNNYLDRCWTDENKDAVWVVCKPEADCITWTQPTSTSSALPSATPNPAS